MNWKQKDFLILDTETTNFPGAGGELVEISIIDNKGNVLVDTLVKPKGEINPFAQKTHGITKQKVQNAPTFKDLYPTIQNIITNKIVMIYNKSFDTAILENCCRFDRLPLFQYESICVMKLYKEHHDLRKNVKLEIASGKETTHRALGDCYDTLDVIKEILTGNKKSIQTKKTKEKQPVYKNKETFRTTYELFLSGKTLEEIAKERSLTKNTIHNHLLQAYQSGLEVDLNVFIHPNNEEQIRVAAKEVTDGKLKTLKNLLPEHITYEEIKTVLVKQDIIL